MRYDSAEAFVDVTATPYDALEARFRDLAYVVDMVSAERKALFDEITRREADARVAVRLEAMSEEGKTALVAAIGRERNLQPVAVSDIAASGIAMKDATV